MLQVKTLFEVVGAGSTKVVNSLFAHYSQYLDDEAIHK